MYVLCMHAVLLKPLYCKDNRIAFSFLHVFTPNPIQNGKKKTHKKINKITVSETAFI